MKRGVSQNNASKLFDDFIRVLTQIDAYFDDACASYFRIEVVWVSAHVSN